MNRAKPLRRPLRVVARNSLATDPLLKKGGAHALRGKRASRARRKQAWLRETKGE